MVADPQRTKMVSADGRRADSDGGDPLRKVKIRALTPIRYPTGEVGPNGVMVDKVFKTGEVIEVTPEDAESFCRPQTGAYLHLGERIGGDAERRHSVLRAERVKEEARAEA